MEIVESDGYMIGHWYRDADGWLIVQEYDEFAGSWIDVAVGPPNSRGR